MSIYAKIGVTESVLKLIAIVTLRWMSDFDKLIVYSFLILIVALLINLSFSIYCYIRYSEVHFSSKLDRSMTRKMLSFISWSSLVSFVELVNLQGVNILLNLFFGPVLNAARGVSYQVSNTLQNFGQNIYVATRPQMIKSFAANEMHNFIQIMVRSTKAIFFLTLLMAIPLVIKLPEILDIWLEAVPQKTVDICRLLIITSLIDSLRNPLWATVQAIGKLKNYSIYGGVIMSMCLPLGYLLFSKGYEPESIFLIVLLIRIIYLLVIWLTVSKELEWLTVSMYSKQVILPIMSVSVCAPIIPILLSDVTHGIISIVLVSVVSVIFSLLCIYRLGLTEQERQFVKGKIQSIMK